MRNRDLGLAVLAAVVLFAGEVSASSYPVADWTHGRVIAGDCTGNTLITGAGDVDQPAMQCSSGGVYVVTARVPGNASGDDFVPVLDVSTSSTSGDGCFEICTAVFEPGAESGELDFGNCQVLEATASGTGGAAVRVTGPGATLDDGAAGDCGPECADDILYIRVTVGSAGACAHNDSNPWNVFGSVYNFGEQ